MPAMSVLLGHPPARDGAGAASLGAGAQRRVIEAGAGLGAGDADDGADLAYRAMAGRAAEHEISAGLADRRAIEHHAHVVLTDVGAALGEAVAGEGVEAHPVAFTAGGNAGLEI